MTTKSASKASDQRWQEEYEKRKEAILQATRVLDEWPLDISVEPLTTAHFKQKTNRSGG